MHMSDALLSPVVAGAMHAASGAAVAASVMKLRRSAEPVKIAEAGVMGAFVFGKGGAKLGEGICGFCPVFFKEAVRLLL